MNLREAKQELREHGYILEKKEQLDEGVLEEVGIWLLGSITIGVVCGIFESRLKSGLNGLRLLLLKGDHKKCLKIIERNKDEIAAEIKDKLLAKKKIKNAIQNGELTKKLVKNSIVREFRSLVDKQYNSKGLQNVYDKWRKRDRARIGLYEPDYSLEGAQNSVRMREITDALTDIVYDAIKDIQLEQE